MFKQKLSLFGFLPICFFVLLNVSGSEVAANEIDDQLEFLQAKLDTLSNTDDSSQKKRLKEILLDSRQLLLDQKEYTTKADLFNKQLKQFPDLIKEAERLAEKNVPFNVNRVAHLSLEEMENRQILVKAELLGIQSQQQQLSSDIEAYRRRSITARDDLIKTNNAINELGSKPIAVTDLDDTKIIEALKNKRDFQRLALINYSQMLELELLVLPKKLEIALKKNTLLTPQVQNLSKEVDWLAETVTHKRKSESEQAIEKSKIVTAIGDWGHPALQALAVNNEDLTQKLSSYSIDLNKVVRKRTKADSQLNYVTRSYSALKQRLTLQGNDDYLGTEIRKQLKQLPVKTNIQFIHDSLNSARLDLLYLEQEKLELADSKAYLKRMLRAYDVKTVSPPFLSMQEAFDELRNTRLQIIDQSLVALNSYIKELELNYSVQNQLNNKINQYDVLLRENLLLTLSAKPLGFQLLDDIQTSILWFVKEDTLKSFAKVMGKVGVELLTIVLLYVPFLWYFRKRYWQRYLTLEEEGANAWGKVHLDKVYYPISLLVFISLQAFLIFLPFNLIHQVFARLSSYELGRALSFAAYVASFTGFIWCFLRLVCRPQGLLISQFKWPAALVGRMYRDVGRYGLTLFILSTFVGFSDVLIDDTLRNSLGRLAFISLCTILAVIAFGWMAVTDKSKRLYKGCSFSFFKHPKLWGSIIFFEQLYMIVMAALGYYFAAVYQKILVVQSVFWFLLCALVFYMSYRGLLIAQRKIAFKRAVAKRGELRAQRDAVKSKSEAELIDDNYVDIKTLSDQSETLLAISVWILLFVGLGAIWIDVLPALGFLDKVVFWSSSVIIDGETEIRIITLKTILTALITLVLVIVATHNLPGALELLVLRHFSLNTGTGYAITTLLKYMIISMGVVVTFQQLGMEWAKLQWLIAALSVGLGFGLQEIVANFVSGLIILFERPVRIGDIITLNNVTGTVSRIHIRATTLIDFNRKEIVVPNKTFITEQLTNWSLSDQITRIQIPIGIAYGSDCEKARNLLLEIAKQNPLVLKDPEPAALFLEFGASSLNFELRCFVDSVSNRLPLINALNIQIHRYFNDAGIVIAFPQLDVHVISDLPKQQTI